MLGDSDAGRTRCAGGTDRDRSVDREREGASVDEVGRHAVRPRRTSVRLRVMVRVARRERGFQPLDELDTDAQSACS